LRKHSYRRRSTPPGGSPAVRTSASDRSKESDERAAAQRDTLGANRVSILLNFRIWLASLAGAAAMTVLTTTQAFAARRLEGVPVNWTQLVPINAIDWLSWGALAPPAIALAAALPLAPAARGRRGAQWAALALVFAFAHSLLEVVPARAFGVVPRAMPFGVMVSARLAETLASSVIVFTAVVVSSYAALYYREARARAERALSLEVRLAESQLDALRRQLQPHFLFNALHTVAGLMAEDVAAARRVLTQVGDLLRASLERLDAQEVAIADEIAFLRAYVDVQRARFGERLRIQWDVDAGVEQSLVPSLLLQPIIENAIRHAVEARAQGGTITVRATRHGNEVHITISDDGPGVEPNERGLGIGLSNARARLALLHPGRHSFTITADPGGGVRVSITLPLRRQEP
jgi:signal transduction histidine kinase